MHLGNIKGNAAAGRVYRCLLRFAGEPVSGWNLAQMAGVTAVSTRISEARRQLPPNERIETIKRGGRFWYRLLIHDPDDSLAVA